MWLVFTKKGQFESFESRLEAFTKPKVLLTQSGYFVFFF
jgi:hypothetical protein